jgi:hypothetical protein
MTEPSSYVRVENSFLFSVGAYSQSACRNEFVSPFRWLRESDGLSFGVRRYCGRMAGQVLPPDPQRARAARQPELAVEPLLLLLLEHEVDDAGAGVRVVLRGRVVDDLDALQRRRRQVVQAVLGAEAGQRRLLAVDQYHDLVAAAHLHLAVLPDRHAGHRRHRLQDGAARLADVVRHDDGLPLHRGRASVRAGGDDDLAELQRLPGHRQRPDVEERTQLADQTRWRTGR